MVAVSNRGQWKSTHTESLEDSRSLVFPINNPDVLFVPNRRSVFAQGEGIQGLEAGKGVMNRV